jgi:hypothetical protein
MREQMVRTTEDTRKRKQFLTDSHPQSSGGITRGAALLQRGQRCSKVQTKLDSSACRRCSRKKSACPDSEEAQSESSLSAPCMVSLTERILEKIRAILVRVLWTSCGPEVVRICPSQRSRQSAASTSLSGCSGVCVVPDGVTGAALTPLDSSCPAPAPSWR